MHRYGHLERVALEAVSLQIGPAPMARCQGEGAKCVIHCDSSSERTHRFFYLGEGIPYKAGLTEAEVINTLQLPQPGN